MPLHASRFCTSLLVAGALVAFSANSQAAAFTPKLGQAGKDVMWLPTPDALVTRLLQMAQLAPTDRLVDLGAGDGKIVIAAARDFGAMARGVEFDPRLVQVAQAQAASAGVSDQARFVQGDIFKTDFSDADVVAMYLLPQLNLKLRPTLLAMRPGTRIVTHWFDMGTWAPDETTEVENRPGYLWIVPANVHGTWRMETAQGQQELTLTQRFQRVEGVLALGKVQTSVNAAVLTGKHLRYGFTDLQGNRQIVRAVIDGDVMRGDITPAAGLKTGADQPTGTSRPFTARRTEQAGPLPGSEPPTEAEMNAAVASLGTE
ncbi:MAG: class I SAM-dependent methyltransferase [Burkholderiaceae bacterium]